MLNFFPNFIMGLAEPSNPLEAKEGSLSMSIILRCLRNKKLQNKFLLNESVTS
jgi:hypothetical protein